MGDPRDGAWARPASHLLIDREHAAVTAAIRSVGGVIGVGDKLVAVPIGQIKVDGEARFVMGQSKQDLEKAPAFDVAKSDLRTSKRTAARPRARCRSPRGQGG